MKKIMGVDYGDARTGLEGQVTNVVLPLPELADGQQVDLWLEADLSDGRILAACTATWYAMHGGISMGVG